MIKKLIDSLFEEIEEPIEEDVEEKNLIVENPSKISSKVTERVEIKDDVKKEVLKKETRSVMIDVDEVKEKTSVKKNIERKTEYEFTKVISPIFGLLEEPDDSESTPSFVQPVRKKMMKSDSVLGTVLSPIYGANVDGNKKDEYVYTEVEEELLTIDDLIEEVYEEPADKYVIQQGLFQEDADFESLIQSLPESEKTTEEDKTVERNLTLFDDFD